MNDPKKTVCAAIDAAAASLFDISAKMHAEVELSFEEHTAIVWRYARSDVRQALRTS